MSNICPSNGSLISIGMPVFNDKAFLSKSLDSILSQTHSNIELIISDDSSSDGSADICKKYALKDKRIAYIRQKQNIGISRNMMFLVSEAKGDFFMWAGNDDLWDKQFIEKLLHKLIVNTKAIVAFCPYTYIDENDNIINKNKIVIEEFGGSTSYIRLKKMIKKNTDGFGYGLFRRKMMVNIEFPVWWGVNKNVAYNNIYPTLAFYLSKGEYEFVNERVLWYNRLKVKSNHVTLHPDNYIKSHGAFILRRFNLIFISIKNIYKGSQNFFLSIRLAPNLFLRWFLFPICKDFYMKFIFSIYLFVKNKFSFNKKLK